MKPKHPVILNDIQKQNQSSNADTLVNLTPKLIDYKDMEGEKDKDSHEICSQTLRSDSEHDSYLGYRLIESREEGK